MAQPSAELTLQRIDSGLHPTVWRLGSADVAGHSFVVLEDGSAAAGDVSVSGPALLWLGTAIGRRLRVEAGTTGYAGWVAQDFFGRALAEASPVAALGVTGQRILELPLPPARPGEIDVIATLAAMLHELRRPQAGSPIVIAAQFRILLVALLRLTGPVGAELAGIGANARFLERFRELVEANFRTHWPVTRYAETIGISPDRLHSLCTRRLGRTPKALIAERLAREAGLGLERSTLSIEQLSYALGFRDPAHFSHFFKRMIGISPGAFRRRMTGTNRLSASPANFADWP
ncbi:MAG TPA: helix-turn-helix transcriptional regulator [Devosia sp.]|nr:helix-turn-helix transcriptional regulator [Devosia sp.]